MYSTEYIIEVLAELTKKIYKERPDNIGIILNDKDINIYGCKDGCYIRLI